MSKTAACLLTVFSVLLVSCGGGGAKNKAPSLRIGESYTTKVKCFGGVSEESLDRAFDMLKKEDQKAFSAMFDEGKIQSIPPGTKVYVEEVSTFGRVKVRLAGSTGSVWIYQDWVS